MSGALGWRAAGVGAALFAALAAGPPARERPRDAAVVRLSAELRELVARYPWKGARWGVLVVSMDRGDTLFAHRPDSAMAPASNMKLLTSAAALRELGPEYRYRTWLLSDGKQEGNVLHGDLVLFGTGDPGISDRFYATKTAVLESLADQLAARGVTRVTGDLVGDASFFAGPLRPSTWDPEDLNDHFAAGVSALSFNENVVTLRVEPAARSALPPTISTFPECGGLAIENQALTTEEAGNLLIVRTDPMGAVSVRGTLQRGGRGVWREITVSDPAAFAVCALRAVLEARGITVSGEDRVVADARASVLGRTGVRAPALGRGGAARVLATHVSRPLRDYLAVVNKRSNNLYAELLFRTLGRVRAGDGSPEGGAAAVAASLAALGVNLEGVVQTDGSGLSGTNRVRASTLVDLLIRMASSREWEEYWTSLPVAGDRRELARMFDTPASGNLRAKTGTIEGVSALSGVVQSRDGERLAFAILVNGTPSVALTKRVENDIGARLASFQRGPDTSLPLVGRLPPPPAIADSGGPSRHQVAPGETLAAIARRYGLTLEELRRANPGVRPDRLRPGSWVVIPPVGSGGGGAPSGERRE